MRRTSSNRAALLAEVAPARTAFALEFPDCWNCGSRWRRTFPQVLDTHEMVRGVDRHKALRNRSTWIRVCRTCHDIVASWPLARQLALKRIHDPDHYDRVEVNRLRGRADNAVTEEEVLGHLRESKWNADSGS